MTVNSFYETRLFDSPIIRAAQESIDFMASVLEASTEYSIIVKDLEGKILLWNEGARRMYGYESKEVISRTNSPILHIPIEDCVEERPKKSVDEK
jgi:PAS domain S-box-containing protein